MRVKEEDGIFVFRVGILVVKYDKVIIDYEKCSDGDINRKVW